MKQGVSIGIVVTMQFLATIAMQLLVIRLVGIGNETDAYIAAQAVPSVVVAITVAALQTAWLPRLSILLDDHNAWFKSLAVARGQAVLLGGGLIASMIACSSAWLPLLLPGFSGYQIEKAFLFSTPLLVAAFFNIQSTLLAVALRAKSRFIVSEIVSLCAAILSLIAAAKLLPIWGIESVVWITLLRSICIYLAQMAFAGWPSISLSKGWKCKGAWSMMRPVLFGASIYKTTPLIDRYWTSLAPVGGVTSLNLAQTAMGALATILERALCMPLTPSFARKVKSEDYAGLTKIYRKGLTRVTLIVILAGILLILLKPIIITLLSLLLKINLDNSEQFWILCILLLGFLHAATSSSLAVTTFHALGDSKTPVLISLLGFSIGFFMKWTLFYSNGINGIAIATSCYLLINIILLNVRLRYVIKKLQKDDS